MLGIIAPIISKVLDQILPGDSPEVKAKRLEIEADLQRAAIQENLAQLDVNKNEALSASVFVSGWRPAAAWVCVFSFAYTAFTPLVNFYLKTQGFGELPTIHHEDLNLMLFGLLGLGGMRSFEKTKKSK